MSDLTVEERLALLEKKNAEMELRLEISELYFEASQIRKRSAEEITAAVCIDYFKISRLDFYDKGRLDPFFKKGGAPRADEKYEKRLIEAQYWFMSIMRYVLHRPGSALKVNYSFYHQQKVANHRTIFLSAYNQTKSTAEERKNSKMLLAILSDIRQKMRDEKVFDEAFD